MPFGKISKVKLEPASLAVVLVFVLGILLFLSVVRSALFGSISEDKRLWFEITFLLLAALLAQVLVAYLRQPTVIGLLIVGAVLSPSCIGFAWPMIHMALSLIGLGAVIPQAVPILVSSSGVISIFAQMGAIFLLFEAGMHGNIDEIFNRKNFIVAALGVVVPFAGGYFYSILSGGSYATSLFYGAALTATSVGVTVSVLMEMGQLSKPFAKTILGAAVIDDVLALLALSAVQGMESASGFSLNAVLALAATSVIFIGGGLVIGLWLVNRFYEHSVGHQDRVLLLALAAVFFYSFAAEFVGLSAIVGAFVAGLVLSQSKHSREILEQSRPISAVFGPIFFLSLGMFIDVGTILPSLLAIVILTIVAFISKILGCGIGALLSGSKAPEAALVGFGMVPRGEIALIIALLGLEAGAISHADYSVISGMAFATTIIPPYLMRKLKG